VQIDEGQRAAKRETAEQLLLETRAVGMAAVDDEKWTVRCRAAIVNGAGNGCDIESGFSDNQDWLDADGGATEDRPRSLCRCRAADEFDNCGKRGQDAAPPCRLQADPITRRKGYACYDKV
jgi:hypothetical protein